MRRVPAVHALLLLLSFPWIFGAARQPLPQTSPFPYPEKLSYRVEWRLVAAGSANLLLSRNSAQNWQIDLNLESAGLVSRLYKVLDAYRVVSNDKFCAVTTTFDAQEGKRHMIGSGQFDYSQHKLFYQERNLTKNLIEKREIDIAPCTYEILGALAAVRSMRLDPGRSVTLPIASGRKMAYPRIEAQVRENVNIGGKSYVATRYEAFIFDNILYRRKGRLFVWLTNDADSIPVQIRLQFGFPIGTITIELEKEQKL